MTQGFEEGKKQSEVKERQGRWTVKRQSRGIRGS